MAEPAPELAPATLVVTVLVSQLVMVVAILYVIPAWTPMTEASAPWLVAVPGVALAAPLVRWVYRGTFAHGRRLRGFWIVTVWLVFACGTASTALVYIANQVLDFAPPEVHTGDVTIMWDGGDYSSTWARPDLSGPSRCLVELASSPSEWTPAPSPEGCVDLPEGAVRTAEVHPGLFGLPWLGTVGVSSAGAR